MPGRGPTERTDLDKRSFCSFIVAVFVAHAALSSEVGIRFCSGVRAANCGTLGISEWRRSCASSV